MKRVMIGVSTAQNTTNATPAALLKGKGKLDAVLLLETEFARKQNWSSGMKSVLERRGLEWLEPLSVPEADTSNIITITQLLEGRLSPDWEVVWNLGGGQKAQQFALWEVFKNQKSGRACYTDPASGNIEFWIQDRGEISKGEASRTEIDFSCGEILEIFNKRLKHCPGPELQPPTGVLDFMDDERFREFAFKVAGNHPTTLTAGEVLSIEWRTHLKARQDLINVALKRQMQKVCNREGRQFFSKLYMINNLPQELAKTLCETLAQLVERRLPEQVIDFAGTNVEPHLDSSTSVKVNRENLKKLTGCSKFAKYFELVVQSRVARLLEDRKGLFTKVLYNAEVQEVGQDTLVAEYDVLIATRKGTLIALDAKTFGFEKKEKDAREHVLQSASGTFASFVPVFPYYQADQQKEYVPSELRKLPWRVKDYRLPVCALMEPQLDRYTPPTENTGRDGTVLIKSLEKTLDQLLE